MRDSKWTSKANLYNPRSCAAFTVFEGKIVVSRGVGDNWNKFKSVEAYMINMKTNGHIYLI